VSWKPSAAARTRRRPPALDPDWFPRLDGAAAHTMVGPAARGIIEVGSGHSTLLANHRWRPKHQARASIPGRAPAFPD
jgi:hypothetical protein